MEYWNFGILGFEKETKNLLSFPIIPFF